VVQAEVLLWSSSELLLEVVDEDGGTTCSVRSGAEQATEMGLWQFGQKLAGGRTRAMVVLSSK
jgi:hypothetical protein